MQKAVVSDQAVINDAETIDTTYVDNEPLQLSPEEGRIIAMIEDCTMFALWISYVYSSYISHLRYLVEL